MRTFHSDENDSSVLQPSTCVDINVTVEVLYMLNPPGKKWQADVCAQLGIPMTAEVSYGFSHV